MKIRLFEKALWLHVSFNYPIMLCNCCCVKFKMSSQISHAKAHHCLWITIFFYSVILQWIKKNYHLDVLAFDPLCKRVFCFHSVCWDGVHARGWTEVGKDCDPRPRPPRSPNLMSGSRAHCSWAPRSIWPPVYHSRDVWQHLPCQLQKKKIKLEHNKTQKIFSKSYLQVFGVFDLNVLS